ncbi:MAG: hypothetical protein F4Y44_11495 [Chloroflexi bacterium]|nr:hypothetical protein [Chloroflexota bacterium]
MILGLVGTPFAALICATIAHFRGLPKPHAGTGAWYSMLFILPWLYLVLRMLGMQVPDGVVRQTTESCTEYGCMLRLAQSSQV